MRTDRQELESIGFEEVGSWHLHGNDPRFALNRLSDAAPVLYAFSIGANVMYVGKTVRTLGERLYGFQKGTGSQRTNIRVRHEIRQALHQGRKVAILGLHDARTLRLGRFVLNLPAALEDDVIRTLNPAWNGAKNNKRGASSADDVLPEGDPQVARQEPSPTPAKGDSPCEGVANIATFVVTVGQTYYRQGFFNVPKADAFRFLGDGSEVKISLPQPAAPVYARVNRTANQNGTPRIMGGTGLRDWFQKRPRPGYLVRVRVQSTDHIDIARL